MRCLYTFPTNQDYVILVNGNLRIFNRILVPNTSTATFSVAGNIYIAKTVGETTPSSPTPSIEGFYSTDLDFVIEGTNDCTLGADRRLNIGGSVIVNASLTGGNFTNQRDLCVGNINHPTVFFQERIDFLLNAPQFIQYSQTIWQEVAP